MARSPRAWASARRVAQEPGAGGRAPLSRPRRGEAGPGTGAQEQGAELRVFVNFRALIMSHSALAACIFQAANAATTQSTAGLRPRRERQDPAPCDHSKRPATRTDLRVHRRENEAHGYLESLRRKYCPATALSLTSPKYGADITPISPSVQPANSRHRDFLTTRTDGSIF